MEKTKFEKLLDDDDILKGVVDQDIGVMLYQNSKLLEYLISTYEDYYVVHLYDHEQDILVTVKDKDLEQAKDLSIEKIEEDFNKSYH